MSRLVVPNPNPNLPRPPDDDWTPRNLSSAKDYIVKLVDAISSELAKKIQRDRAVSEILLSSDDGSVYRVKVSNTGVLFTEVVYKAP